MVVWCDSTSPALDAAFRVLRRDGHAREGEGDSGVGELAEAGREGMRVLRGWVGELEREAGLVTSSGEAEGWVRKVKILWEGGGCELEAVWRWWRLLGVEDEDKERREAGDGGRAAL